MTDGRATDQPIRNPGSKLAYVVFWGAGAFVFAFALSAWSISQGGPTLQDFISLDAGRRHISAYFAVPLTGGGLVVLAWATHRSRQEGGPATPRLVRLSLRTSGSIRTRCSSMP